MRWERAAVCAALGSTRLALGRVLRLALGLTRRHDLFGFFQP